MSVIPPDCHRLSTPHLPSLAADHRLPLAEDWQMWRTIYLRGTGFPIQMLENLAASDGCQTIRAFLDAEERVDALLKRAQALCRSIIIRSEGEERRIWRCASRRLAKRRSPQPIAGATDANHLFQTLGQALKTSAVCRQRALDQIEQDCLATSRYLKWLSTEPRFREAITWQNRQGHWFSNG